MPIFSRLLQSHNTPIQQADTQSLNTSTDLKPSRKFLSFITNVKFNNQDDWTVTLYEDIKSHPIRWFSKYTLTYIAIKFILWIFKWSSFCDKNNWFDVLVGNNGLCEIIVKPIGNDVYANMDLLGYFIGLFTFYLGLKITFLLEQSSKESSKAMERFLEQIDNKTNNLVDATRDFINNFQVLFKETKLLLQEALDNKGELYVMNKTSSFGRIHTYNYKFVSHFRENPPFDFDEEQFKKGVVAFNKQIEDVERLLIQCATLPRIKFTFYNETILDDRFLELYFQSEDSDQDYDNQSQLRIYSVKSDKIRFGKKLSQEKNKRLTKQKLIKEAIKRFHKEAIENLKQSRNSLSHNYRDTNTVIEEINDESKIPMQMYLTKFEKDGITEYRTLVIFAVDEKEPNDNKKRTLIGIKSSIKEMYDVFKTFFV